MDPTKVTPAAKMLLNTPMEDLSSAYATNLASEKQEKTPSPTMIPLPVTSSGITKSQSRPTVTGKPLDQRPAASLLSAVEASAPTKPVHNSMNIFNGVSAFSPSFNAKSHNFETASITA